MELTDILSIDGWADFEKELHDRFHLNCTVYNVSGIGITGKPNWTNKICPVIKANKDSLAAICAPGNQNFMAQAQKTKQAVIGECDAGLMKIAVPIFVDQEFIGTAGGCGSLPEGGEVETFLIGKTTGMDEAEINELGHGLESITEDQSQQMAAFIENRIQYFIYHHNQKKEYFVN